MPQNGRSYGYWFRNIKNTWFRGTRMPQSAPNPMSTVLIIEDDADNRSTIAKLFATDGWKVLEANDGDAGLEIGRASCRERV